MTLRLHLREATASLHRALEARLDLLAPDLSLERYVRVLLGLHGYYGALEPRLGTCVERCRCAFPLRSRAPLLVQDLVELGTRHEELERAPRCRSLPALEGIEQLAGCVYVLEGACLGGRVVARGLRHGLGLDAEHGCSFFSDAGKDVVPRWALVTDWLEEVGRQSSTDAIVASAAATFRTMTDWLGRRGALR